MSKQKTTNSKLRIWLKALLALILAGILAYGALFAVVLSGSHSELQPAAEPELMIILGCQVKSNGPSATLQDRLDTALDYLEDYPDMTVVVSGGQGPDEPTTEARCMADYLMDHGISEEQILLEDQSHNTMENLIYTIDLLSETEYDAQDEVLIVSSAFHLARARMLWARFSGNGENLSTLAAPVTHQPSSLKMHIREPLALVKSFLLDRGVANVG